MKMRLLLLLMTCLAVSLVNAGTPATESTGTKDAPQMELKWEKVADNLVFPEGPAWNGKDALFFSNCHGGFISRLDEKGCEVWLRAQEEPFLFTKTNGMTFGKDGALYACDFGRKAILRFDVEKKTSTVYAELTDGKKLNGPNDLAFDAKGNLYFSDPGKYSRTERNGGVYRVAAGTKKLELMKDDLGFPNGLCFTKDGRTLNGNVKHDRPDEIVLTIAADQEVRIARENVEEVVPGQVSVMPSGLDQQMSMQELADLVAFLKANK